MNDYQTKLEQFAALLQVQSQIQCKLSGVGCQANLDNCRTRIVPGRKYDKVNVGGSGRFMVDRTTGAIFGIKGYGQVHLGHRYGGLDTITSWWWGRYDTRRITASYPAPAGWEAMIRDCNTADAERHVGPATAAVAQGFTVIEVQEPHGLETRYTPSPRTADSAYPSLIINAQGAL